jgi:hypothetical protein
MDAALAYGFSRANIDYRIGYIQSGWNDSTVVRLLPWLADPELGFSFIRHASMNSTLPFILFYINILLHTFVDSR